MVKLVVSVCIMHYLHNGSVKTTVSLCGVLDLHIRTAKIKLLRQGYCYFKLQKTFSKFYRRHSALVENITV